MTFVLGLACGAIVALPFAELARRQAVAERARPLADRARSPIRARRSRARRQRPRVLASVLRVMGAPRARRRVRRRESAIASELPVVIDLVGVALSAGCTPFLAIEHAARFGPSRTATALRGVSQACALGQSLDDALHDLATEVVTLRPLVEALRTTARLGAPAAPALARIATEVRADVRRRAEARARTVPVRLCFPLVACILPAFALLTVAPVVLGGMRS